MYCCLLYTSGITVNKNGFGALPIQRISSEASAHLLRKAYEAGIDFYDTARFYTDSEEDVYKRQIRGYQEEILYLT